MSLNNSDANNTLIIDSVTPPNSTWYLISSLFVCSIGIITNLINISVFLNPRVKEPCFKFMLGVSVASFVHVSLLNLYPFIIYCNCPLSQSYSAAMYMLIVKDYAGPCLATFRIISEICLSFHILCILINTSRFKWIASNYFIVAMVLFAFSYYLPVPLLKTIVEKTLDDDGVLKVYSVGPNWAGKTLAGRVITFMCDMVRLFLTIFILTSINVATLIKMWQRYGNRNRVANVSNMRSSNSNNGLTENG
jgi:hypothetical protein